MRYLVASYLCVWLAGWVAGEALSIGALLMVGLAMFDPGSPLGLLPPVPATGLAELLLAGLFLMGWLGCWTVGGLAAMRELLRVLWGSDRIMVQNGALELRRTAGPLVYRARIEPDDLHGIELRRRDGTLVARTTRKRVVLTNLGTRAERARLRDALCSALGLARNDTAGADRRIDPPQARAVA